MKIGEVASNAEDWMGKLFQNLTIYKVEFWFLKLEKNSINLLIFHVGKLVNSLIFHFGELQKLPKF